MMYETVVAFIIGPLIQTISEIRIKHFRRFVVYNLARVGHNFTSSFRHEL